jgi:integrase
MDITAEKAKCLHAPKNISRARFCFLTGRRASEAFSLTWGAVDFSRGSITFPETKNHDSQTIPMTTALMELFDAMGQGLASGLVLLTSNGAPY